MARVRMIKPEEADADTRKVYDGVREQWGRISNFSQVLAHQPAALAGWMLPNETIRLANVKSDPDYVKIQQLVIIKTSALNQSAYCMSHNVPLGKKLGLTEAQIKATQGGDYMLKAYIAVVIGGWGSIPGAVAGALLIALFEVVYPSLPLLIPALPVSWHWPGAISILLLGVPALLVNPNPAR